VLYCGIDVASGAFQRISLEDGARTGFRGQRRRSC
jgi:hypothetical protein